MYRSLQSFIREGIRFFDVSSAVFEIQIIM